MVKCKHGNELTSIKCDLENHLLSDVCDFDSKLFNIYYADTEKTNNDKCLLYVTKTRVKCILYKIELFVMI